MTEPILTPRLEMILSLAPRVETYCDIGTDHGYIAAALACRGGRVIAMDINSGPLEQAESNIRRFGLEEKIETRLSDGFSALSGGEAECAVIAGMGGELIAAILAGGIKGAKYLVLQPQSKIYELRDYLSRNGYRIEKEEICREDRRYYVGLLAVPGRHQALTEDEKHVGPLLIKNRHPLLSEYAASRIHELENILEKIGNAATSRRDECMALIDMYKKYQIGG